MSRRERRRGSSMDSNEKMMLAICVIVGCVVVCFAVAAITQGESASEALAGSFCIGMVGLVPLVILIVSRRRSRGKRHRTDMVKSHSSAPQGYVEVHVTAGEAFPKLCVRCGAETRRVSKFKYEEMHTDANRYDWSRINPFLMVFLFWQFATQMILAKLVMLFERFSDRRRAQSQGMEFRIPHCRKCARTRPIIQRHFDFHGRQMIILAPLEFRSKLYEMRENARK